MPMSVIAGNWKMNTSLSEARSLVSDFKNSLDGSESVEVIVCPPFISLAAVSELVEGSKIKVGGQNLYPAENGAFTGEVSPRMLADFCEYVIVGHSERRQHFGESDEFVNEKVKIAQSFGLKPILCVGEQLDDREAGNAEEVVGRQVRDGLAGVEKPSEIIVAYEPVWAIGTGRSANPEVAQGMTGYIRKTLVTLFGPEIANETSILYGGSANAENISEYIQQADVNGALVGGASLAASTFSEMIQKASA